MSDDELPPMEGRAMWVYVLRKLKAKHDVQPETITVQNVLIHKDSKITMYVVPGNSESFVGEDRARKNRQEGQSMYKVEITRIE